MADPWRFRCPKGHTSIEKLANERAHRCESCQIVYAGEPVDAKEIGGFPVEREIIREATDVSSETILDSLIEITDDPIRNWVPTREIATDVGADPRHVGLILSNLEDDGRVERLQDKAHSSWSIDTYARATVDPRAMALLVLAVGIILTITAGGVTAL